MDLQETILEQTSKKEIKLSTVIELLEKGYSRTPLQKMYNPEIGSIQEYFNLSQKETMELFKHPELKGKKTKRKTTNNFIIINDL